MTVWAACVVAWVTLVILLRVRRLWLPYYVLASAGFTLLFVLAVKGTAFEETLEALTAEHAHILSNALDIPTLVFENVPDTLLVLVVVGHAGWTVVEVGIECSGLLELTAFAGLLGFYPGLRVVRRSALMALGLVATYAINILRLLLIIGFLHFGGKDVIFLAHTVIGRGVFFVLVVFVYWLVFTRAAIRTVRERMEST